MAEKGKYVYEWPRPMVTVDAVVFGLFGKKVQVLLINRANEPFKGRWALPGGFVDIGEELEDAVARELCEETGLEGVSLEQMHTFGRIGRDPRGRQITVVYLGVVTNAKTKVRAGDDAGRVKWFDIERLPKELAFDHADVIAFALRRLRRKKVYRSYSSGGR